jgi:hypothetical protein
LTVAQRWLGETAQRDKWIVGLKAARMAVHRRHDEQATAPES